MADEAKSLELQTLEKQIAHLQAAADNKTQKLWEMSYDETYDFQHRVLIPLEAKQQERRILLGRIKAAETRRRNAEAQRKEKAAGK